MISRVVRMGGGVAAAVLLLGTGCPSDGTGDDDPVPATGSTSSVTSTTSTTTAADTTEGPGSSSSGEPSVCSAEGVMGGEPGQVVPDVPVTRCDGAVVSLQEMACGFPLTLIDIGGAGFSECVEATMEYATGAEYDELQARGLQIVQVFALDNDNNVPTQSFCNEYVQMHEIDFDFAIDQLGATHQLAPFYPFNLVVDGSGEVIHRWEGADIPEDKVEILGALLDAAR